VIIEHCTWADIGLSGVSMAEILGAVVGRLSWPRDRRLAPLPDRQLALLGVRRVGNGRPPRWVTSVPVWPYREEETRR
jgi:hypothetical protein